MNQMQTIIDHIISLEKTALDRWGHGDPGGFLEISADDVVYFDPYVEKRIDGKAALHDLYQMIWGKIHVDRFEMIDPKVQLCGEIAVLTFNHVSYAAQGQKVRWNCTEVFRKQDEDWRIIQTHWSYTCHPCIVTPSEN